MDDFINLRGIVMDKKRLFDLQVKYNHHKPWYVDIDEEEWWESRNYWLYVSSFETLSEDFIRDFQDYVIWGNISFYQTLSEDFIREFADKLYWEDILRRQNLSEEFKDEMRKKGYF